MKRAFLDVKMNAMEIPMGIERDLYPDKVRIEFRCRMKKKSLISLIDGKRGVIQGEPLVFSLKITNIGLSPTDVFTISNFLATNSSAGIGLDSNTTFHVPILNPNQYTIIDIESGTFKAKGSCWISMKLNSSTGRNIQSFQYDEDHGKDCEHKEINAWGCALYVDGRLELLQQRTNTLIIALTTVTVIEAIWKVNNAIKFFWELIHKIIYFIVSIFT